MPAIINIAANIIFGAALALVAKESPSVQRRLLSWAFLFLVGFQAVVVTPIATYLFRFYPQWSMLYWFDPQVFPGLEQWVGWLSAAAIALNFVGALIGYFVARWGVLTDTGWLRAAPIVIACAAIAYLIVAFGERVVFIGEYDAYWSGHGQLLFKSLAGWLGVSLYIGGFLFVLWVHTRFGAEEPRLF